jgi:hypothetical protein
VLRVPCFRILLPSHLFAPVLPGNQGTRLLSLEELGKKMIGEKIEDPEVGRATADASERYRL